MSGEAIAMLIVSILIIWGGLLAAIINLITRSPEEFTAADAAEAAREREL